MAVEGQQLGVVQYLLDKGGVTTHPLIHPLTPFNTLSHTI